MEATHAATAAGWTWAARILKGLLVAFLVVDGGMKAVRAGPAVEATLRLGVPPGAIAPIGLLLLALTLLYAIPRTTPLGAVLLTGYLGGAVATQVLARADPFPIAFPIAFGALLWAVPMLTDGRVRAALQRR